MSNSDIKEGDTVQVTDKWYYVFGEKLTVEIVYEKSVWAVDRNGDGYSIPLDACVAVDG